jgi:hypothetical protein
MALYIVKNTSGTFAPDTQPDGFRAILGIENRLFITECPTPPNGELVVEFPQEIYDQLPYYHYAGNKKLPFDPFNGAVTFEDVIDKKGRQRILYTDAQFALRLSIMKWMMINVYLADKARMQSMTQAEVDTATAEINALPDDITAKSYLATNLYHDL